MTTTCLVVNDGDAASLWTSNLTKDQVIDHLNRQALIPVTPTPGDIRLQGITDEVLVTSWSVVYLFEMRDEDISD